MKAPIRSLRLTQLWRYRLEPMLSHLPKFQADRSAPLPRSEFFEAVGLLAEGVFCGYFDPHEANVVLVLISPLRELFGQPDTVTNESLGGMIWGVRWSEDPFRESLQMTDGPQKEFELPLFAHALQLADRLSNDPLAQVCTECIYTFDDERWSNYKKAWPLVNTIEVDALLNDPQKAAVNLDCLSAGFIRLLEHMGSSMDFFSDYAKSRSRGRDFESYLLRIGGLNGWRIPLADPRLGQRFRELPDLFEFTVRADLKDRYPDVEWSTLGQAFTRRLKTLASAWEECHLLGSLVTR